MRELRADLLLTENIRALLHRRGEDAHALAIWCGHGASWISKVLSGDRGVQIRELGRIADFFGLTVAELFSPGISPLTERRKRQRRTGEDRRALDDRRVSDRSRLHPDVHPFKRRDDDRDERVS